MAYAIAMNITSKIVAFSSVVAFALQIAFALLMLRYFSPEEVGTFSVISQIGFFWTTLALAQAPLQLLANHGISVFDDARHAWVSSLQRFVWLSPVSALAVWWSGLTFVNSLLWALLLSLCQLTWMLAQSMCLRMSGVWAQAGVRVLPPLMAMLVAAAAVFMEWSGSALLAAALLGYSVGAAWLFPVFLIPPNSNYGDYSKLSHAEATTFLSITITTDDRPTALRMAHTLADALLATAIVVVWQCFYGAQETGWMSTPLRIMAFVPSVLHIAWAQVELAQPQHTRTNPLWVGLVGAVCVGLIAFCCEVALKIGCISEEWQGVRPYLIPLVFWQGSACMVAAFSHLPFHSRCARKNTWICMFVAGIQGVTLIIFTKVFPNLSPDVVFTIFSIFSTIGLLGINWWQRNI